MKTLTLPKKKIKRGVLKNWQFDEGGSGNIVGEIYNDSRWPDGTVIHTTPATKITVVTKNSIYTLDPHTAK